MYGSRNASASPTSGGAFANITQMVTNTGGMKQAQQSALNGPSAATPWVIVGLVALYLFWALLQQHERIRSQIEPKNIALNLHNLFAIALPVAVAFLLAKVAAVKYAAFKLPGGKAVSEIAGAL